MKAIQWLTGAVLAVVGTAALAGGATKPVVNFSVQELPSTAGVVPQPASADANSIFYPYEVVAGYAVTDTLPIKLCASSQAGTDKFGNPVSGYPQTLDFSASHGNLPGVTVPGNVSFAADGCVTVDVSIDTGALSAGEYTGNINLGVVNSQDPTVTSPVNSTVNLGKPNEIHIHAKATNPVVTTHCFTTDSDFNFLADCAGNLVTSGYGGTFAIQANKKGVEVATNPGQFYYNLLYTNYSGADQVINVSFVRSGVNPHGTQAIHAMVFPSMPLLSAGNFDAVNSDIPSGADDALESVTVPAGWTLWTDYHLEWAGLGGAVPANIGTSCPAANQGFGVTAYVYVNGVSAPIASCGAGAVGYGK
jgi:hypothetical protein